MTEPPSETPTEKVVRSMSADRRIHVTDEDFDPSAAAPPKAPRRRSAKSKAAGGGGVPPPPPSPPDGSADDPHLEACAAQPETDIGNGRRCLIRSDGNLLFVANMGPYVYDNRRFAPDETGRQSRKLAHHTAEAIVHEIKVLGFPDRLERKLIEEADSTAAELRQLRATKADERSEEQAARLRDLIQIEADAGALRKRLEGRRVSRARHAKSSAGSSKLDNMLQEAAPYITRKIDELDSDPLALNCENGTLRFSDVGSEGQPLWVAELSEHRREDLHSKCCAAPYHEEALAPLFETFLERMLPDPDVRAFAQRFLGYALTGLTREQVFVFFYGSGRNGKSTLVDIVCRILADYTTTVPIETLAGDQRRKGGDATPDLMRIPGARLVRSSEPDSSVKLKEPLIKALTSDEPILIRALHRDFNEIYPTFKLLISGNHKPRIDNDDTGMWRRVLLVPWEVQLDRAEADKMLGRKLWAGREGILAWLVRGALSYLQQGLNPPAAVLAATDDYRAESNPIGAFLDAMCVFTGDLRNDRMPPGDLFVAYEAERIKQGWPQFQLSTFTRRLPDQAVQRGAVRQKSGGLMIYQGVRLKTFYEKEEEELRSRDPAPPSSEADF